jgi:transcriptional regulator GlxA family with amidase domain
VSGELTTSRGPGTAFQFALSFVEQLFGPCKAEDMDNTLLTKVDDNLERSIEVNEIEWSSDHNPHGGPAGAERLHKSSVLKKLLKEQKQTGRMYGGICSSPVILQKQGLLQVTF